MFEKTKKLLHKNKKLIMNKFINDLIAIHSLYITMQKMDILATQMLMMMNIFQK